MRNELKEKNGERMVFTAIVERFGKKTNYHGYSEDTMLLRDVRFAASGEPATDHLWFTIGKTIESQKLSAGTRIQFEARVQEYTKGYVNQWATVNNRKRDYKLSRPSRFVRLV